MVNVLLDKRRCAHWAIFEDGLRHDRLLQSLIALGVSQDLLRHILTFKEMLLYHAKKHITYLGHSTEDNEDGTRSSLEKLARYVEQGAGRLEWLLFQVSLMSNLHAIVTQFVGIEGRNLR